MNIGRAGIATAAACLLAISACSSGTQPTEAISAPQAAIDAAKASALEVAGGKEIGGKVTMLGVLGGPELDAFNAVLAPFEEATGIDVQYEGTRDFAAILQTRVNGGNPPDMVSTPAIGEVSALAAKGDLENLRDVIGDDVLNANFSKSLLDTGSLNGELFGIFDQVNLGGLVWYDPKTYKGPTNPASWDELQQWARSEESAGTSPWCVGLESGAASGWPAADFIDEILLRQAGPEFHERWRNGQEPWTSQDVKTAFETYGATVAGKMAYGGTTTVLSTNFAKAANPMFTSPPGCYLNQQATFMGGIIMDSFPDLKAGTDLDFFPVPDFNPQFPGIRSISGEIIGVLTTTPQSAALAKYFATPEAATLIAATGRWLSPNTNVKPDAYADPFLKKASQVLADAKATQPLGNSLMAQTEVDAFWKAALDYTKNPDQLDAILANVESAK